MSNRAITGCSLLVLATALVGEAFAQEENQASSSASYGYQYTAPYPRMDGEAAVITVRQNGEGLSIAHIHAADAPTPLLEGDPEDFELSSSAMFLAGPATDGRIVSPEPIAGGVLVDEGAPAFKAGQRYADGEAYNDEADDSAPSWAVEDLEIAFSDGSDDKLIAGRETDHRQLSVSYTLTRYGSDGEVRNTESVDDTRDFWFAKGLPYSPLQTIPNRYDPAYFTPSGYELLDEAIQERVRGDMQSFGAVLAQEGEGPGGMSGGSQVSRLEDTETFMPEALSAIPVLPGDQADTMLGALFVTEMLRDGDRIPEGGSLNLSIGEGLSSETGRAAWREMPNGDFGIALHPGEGTAEGSVLLLMRPVNGVPAAGSYGVAGVKSRESLSQMDEAGLEDYAGKFQPMGMVRQNGQDFVVTGFSDGGVTIDESGEGTVSGSLDATLSLIAIDGSGETGELDVSGAFMAVDGLEARFQSPVSRVRR
ncbi:hypothetical protein [Henriciella sp.]|uniref:hypothetical protein n=1 Tax=Henriciella sp. TaxID=1968823 RepID=UPI00261C2428|nr:hypothetical protein [Henriciella sp.]